MLHEGYFAARRASARAAARVEARATARELGLPLVVLGEPAEGQCGDLTLAPAIVDACPAILPCDLGRPLPLPDGCGVVLVEPGALEEAHDAGTAWAEIDRISDGRAFTAAVEPWTIAGLLALRRGTAPPARFTVPPPARWRAPLPR